MTKLLTAVQFASATGVTYRTVQRWMANGYEPYFTASRKTAIEQLTWFQVKFDEELIYLNPEGRKQTKKKRPPVPIVRELLPFLKAAKEKRGDQAYVLGSAGAIRRTFNTAVRDAGLAGTGVTPHTLRHTRAVHLAQDGVDLYAIAGLLGDSLETVERNYLHHCPHHIKEKIERARNAGL